MTLALPLCLSVKKAARIPHPLMEEQHVLCPLVGLDLQLTMYCLLAAVSMVAQMADGYLTNLFMLIGVILLLATQRKAIAFPLQSEKAKWV